MRALQLLAPLALACPAWVVLVAALRRGSRTVAAARVALWAVILAVALPAGEAIHPGLCAALFPGAATYAAGMAAWADSGSGCEGDPECFLPQHATHAAAFAAATLATGGLAGLAFAAVLFGWMGAYAGALGQASGHPVAAAVLCWHPWALVRVAAFVALGVALAEPLARRGLPPRPGGRRWLAAGLAGLLLDAALKALAAEPWRRLVLEPLLR